MSTKVAVLYGGPADQIRQVVAEWPAEILFAVLEPINVNMHDNDRVTYVRPREAVYMRYGSPINMADARNIYGRDMMYTFDVPDHEVALYLYLGTREGKDKRR